MLTKKIDRYVSRSFLFPFIGILVLIFVLYASFDLLKKMDELQQMGAENVAGILVRYYAYLFPVFILDTVPIVVVVSAGLALVPMSKNRELLILKSSGISIYRIVLPIFVWTLLISAGSFWVRESVVPVFSQKKELLARKLEQEKSRSLLLKDEGHNRTFYIDTYNFSTDIMHRLTIVEHQDSAAIKRIIEADKGSWGDDHHLILTGVDIRQYGPEGLPRGKPRVKTEMTLSTTLSRADMVEAQGTSMGGQAMTMPLDKLAARIEAAPHIPGYRVALHSRLASVLVPFLLLLVGIPILVGFENTAGNRFLGVLTCVLVAAGHYVLVFVCNSMGETGVLPAIMAGWLPVFITGPAGVWLFGSMLT